MTSQSQSSRKQCDFSKLITAGYDLELIDGNTQDFNVTFYGPRNTAYEKGVWAVHVTLPDNYPFASPSIGFLNKMLHPNVDEQSGSVCLDVINQTWTPLYSLVNVFEVFLPQLLAYPNPTDPLNKEAASLFISDRKQYEECVRAHVRMHANPESYGRYRLDSGRQDKQTDLDGIRTPYSELSNGEIGDTVDVDSLDIDDL